MFGDIHQYKGYEAELSRRLHGMPILHCEYSLCPEVPMPRAVEQCVALYRAVLNRDKDAYKRMIVGGESAGGGLTLLFIQSLIKQGLPLPCAAVLLSPWADLSLSGPSYTSNVSTDVLINPERLKWNADICFGGAKRATEKHVDRRDPLCSAVYASFTGFPSLLIVASEAELFASDSNTVYQKCREAGVDVEYIHAEHMMHGYPFGYHYFPEARHGLDQIQELIQKKLGNSILPKPKPKPQTQTST
jgi:monoterpene epsilon-lactone hydrolase